MRNSQDARLLGAFVAMPVLFLASTAPAQVPCTYFAAPLAEEGEKVPEGEPFAARYNVGTPDHPIIRSSLPTSGSGSSSSPAPYSA